MQARMKNPASVLSGIYQPIQELVAATKKAGVPDETLELVHLRASQINGCSACVHFGFQNAGKADVSAEKLFMVSAWREAPFFSDAERAALNLAEHVTRIADSLDPVPDAVWDEAANHYDEKELAAITTMIAVTNMFNRMNATTRQIAGRGW